MKTGCEHGYMFGAGAATAADNSGTCFPPFQGVLCIKFRGDSIAGRPLHLGMIPTPAVKLLKRLDALAAVEAEITAFKAGSLPKEAPAHLPADALQNRKFYLSTLERDAKHFADARRHTRENYLRWLARMAEVARVGKNTEINVYSPRLNSG
jgi:hypothetical protein